MRLILGLGNPGPRYARTRHNVGYQCIDHFSRRYHIPLASRRRYALLGTGEVEETPVALARSRTYMNESGVTAAYLVRRFRALPQDLLVVYDDLDLLVGKVRVRSRGSSGGHRGMESVIEAVGSEEVPRIRVGIGRPAEVDEIRYVLSPFTPAEEPLIQEAIRQVSDALLCILTEGMDQAMNRYN